MSGIPAGAGQLLGKRLGKFEILALLALGGTAEIYLARIGGAAGFEKYVVVKCLHDHLADDAEFVKMFLDEARLAAHLDHSNIVQTMELGQHDGRYYMVMEFLAGLSLAMIVRRATERLPTNRIPVPLVLNMLAQSCAGLHYAHEKAMNGKALNIVHRDISPQNLVISFEGVVKVVDFGIAKAELRETRTRSGTIKGKFAYMSPEQCVANNVDRRTDVFALGIIGHELLTGKRLFKRPSPYETYQAVIECDVKPPSTVDAAIDPAIDAVIMRATAKDKTDRYPSAEAFGDALLGYLHHRGIGSGPGDVSRFFDAHFSQEIDEHSARMRELISGREISVDTGANWGGDDAEDEAKRVAAGEKPRKKPTGGSPKVAASKPAARKPADVAPPNRPSAGDLSMVIDELGGGSRGEADDELGGGSRGEADDEMPAERTRIESNPLGQMNELDRLVSKTPPPKPAAPKLPPSGALRLPAPPPGPAAQANPSGPVAAASPPGAAAQAGSSGPSGLPPSGRFPELANLPTMIAEPDPEGDPVVPSAFVDDPTMRPSQNIPSAASGFANDPTAPLSSNVLAAASGLAHAPTAMAAPIVPPAAPGFANAPTALANPAFAKTQIAAPSTAQPGYSPPPNGAPPPGPQPPHQQPAMPPGYPQGYPVMNAQMSAQIAIGASVFPSEQRGSQPHSAPQVAPPSVPHQGPAGPASPGLAGPGPAGPPGPRNPELGGMLDGYPQAAPQQRGPDGGPGQMGQGQMGQGQMGQGQMGQGQMGQGQMGQGQMGQGQMGQMGQMYGRNGNPGGPQRPPNMMPPVGQPYPEQAPWRALVASRIHQAPPWVLVLLFVGALGIALALTVVIAKMLS